MKQKGKVKNMKIISGIAVILAILFAIVGTLVGPAAIIYGNDQKVVFGAVACTAAVVVAAALWGYLSTGISSKKAKVASFALLILATAGFAASLISGFDCDSQRYLTWAACLTTYITVGHPILFGVLPLLH